MYISLNPNFMYENKFKNEDDHDFVITTLIIPRQTHTIDNASVYCARIASYSNLYIRPCNCNQYSGWREIQD